MTDMARIARFARPLAPPHRRQRLGFPCEFDEERRLLHSVDVSELGFNRCERLAGGRLLTVVQMFWCKIILATIIRAFALKIPLVKNLVRRHLDALKLAGADRDTLLTRRRRNIPLPCATPH